MPKSRNRPLAGKGEQQLSTTLTFSVGAHGTSGTNNAVRRPMPGMRERSGGHESPCLRELLKTDGLLCL